MSCLLILFNGCDVNTGNKDASIDNGHDNIQTKKSAADYYNSGYSIVNQSSIVTDEALRAISYFDSAITINPNYAEAYFQRGTLRCWFSAIRRDGDKEGAIVEKTVKLTRR